MRRTPKTRILQQGQHYRLGTTDGYGAIWRKRFGRWWVVSRYPQTEDGWKVAQDLFTSFEPVSSPISQTTSRGGGLITVGVIIVLIAAVGVGAFAIGRSTHSRGGHPSAVATTAPPPNGATTPSSAPRPPPTTAVVGDTFALSDTSGDGLSVTLEQVVNPDQIDNGVMCPNGNDVFVAVVLQFVNEGSTVLTTGGPGNGLTFVSSTATPFSFVNDHGCSIATSTDAAASCATSTNAMDLSPGESAIWCPALSVPASDTLTEIQFDASNAFGGSNAFSNGGNTLAVWHIGGSSPPSS